MILWNFAEQLSLTVAALSPQLKTENVGYKTN